MQDGFIDFVDIKLQSAEQTRLKLKEYVDFLYAELCKCNCLSELNTWYYLLIDVLHYAYIFGLIHFSTKVVITEKVNDVYKLRSNSFKNDFMEEN